MDGKDVIRFVQSVNGLHWDMDFRRFCDMLGLSWMSKDAEGRWYAWCDLHGALKRLGTENLVTLLEGETSCPRNSPM